MIAQRVQIGNRQRIGHQTTRPRAPPRPDGNIIVFRPFDKIGNDQKVAGEPHALDDAQLEIQPLFIFFDGGGMGDHLQPVFQPLMRLPLELFDLVIRELRQDRITAIRHKGTALGDLDRVLDGFGQISKQRHHLGLRFEVMLRGQPAAFVLLIDIGPIRDTDQRVMGLVHIGLGEIDVIRRDQRDAHVIGHLHKAPFGQLFGQRLAILAGVALQLDIKPVGKSPVQPCHQCLCRGALTALQQLPHGAARPARQTDQPTVQRLQLL